MLIRLILAIVTLAALAQSAPPAHAQLREPARVAAAVADCFTATMPDEITAPAYVEATQSAQRVVVPLRGQPGANREVQSPPPAEDALAWFDLRRYEDEGSLPPDWNPILPYRVNAPSGIYIVDGGGYYWLRARHVSQLCLEAASGGFYQPTPS